mgnify:CR=1 FL=1
MDLPDPPESWGWGASASLFVGALAHSGRWRGRLAESTDQHTPLTRSTASPGRCPAAAERDPDHRAEVVPAQAAEQVEQRAVLEELRREPGVGAEQQARLVDAVADEGLAMVNEILDEAARAEKGNVTLEGEEQIIWEGRPFLSLVESYMITSERVKISKGLLGKDYENFELIRIQDIDVSRGLGERMLGLGDIQIKGADPSTPEIVLRNIKDPTAVYEALRKAWLAARKRYGLIFREEM